MCICHKSIERTIHFNTVDCSKCCWCGLNQKGRDELLGVRMCAKLTKVKFSKAPLSLKRRFLYRTDYLYFVSNYVVCELIGRGSYYNVRRGLKYELASDSWKFVAMKFIFQEACLRKDVPIFKENGSLELVTAWDRMVCEWHLHSLFDHQNIANFIEVIRCDHPGNVYVIVLEYVPYPIATYKNECYVVDNNMRYTETGVKHICKQVLNAISYMHTVWNVVHKDIKPENLLLTRKAPSDWLEECETYNTVNITDPSFLSMEYVNSANDYDSINFLWDNDASSDSETEYIHQDSIDIRGLSKCVDCSECCSSYKVQRNGLQKNHKLYRLNEKETVNRKEVETNSLNSYYGVSNEYYLCWCCHEYIVKCKSMESLTVLNEHLNLRQRVCSCCGIALRVHVADTHNSVLPLVKIIDFNVAVQVSAPDYIIHDAEGTRYFTPPECLSTSGIKFGFKRDVWSIGILAYCLRTGRLPITGKTAIDLLMNILETTEVDLSSIDSTLFSDFLRGLLQTNPGLRFTIFQAKEHKWIKDL